MNNSKLYICVREEVDAFMVPTLVAHTILNADTHFLFECGDEIRTNYLDWFRESFKKVVLKVNAKEWKKILEIPNTYFGYENTQLWGEHSCAILPIMEEYPNVIKYAKTWKP